VEVLENGIVYIFIYLLPAVIELMPGGSVT
jgi:hypothetical protein